MNAIGRVAPIILEVGSRMGVSGHLHTVFALAREGPPPHTVEQRNELTVEPVRKLISFICRVLNDDCVQPVAWTIY